MFARCGGHTTSIGKIALHFSKTEEVGAFITQNMQNMAKSPGGSGGWATTGGPGGSDGWATTGERLRRDSAASGVVPRIAGIPARSSVAQAVRVLRLAQLERGWLEWADKAVKATLGKGRSIQARVPADAFRF